MKEIIHHRDGQPGWRFQLFGTLKLRQGRRSTTALGFDGAVDEPPTTWTNQLLLRPITSFSPEGRRPGHLQAPSRGTYGQTEAEKSTFSLQMSLAKYVHKNCSVPRDIYVP